MENKKEIITDLHIHSRFSRATSKNLTLPNIVKYARIKGVDLLGTGDFTHPEWLKELKQGLKEKSKDGIFWYKDAEGEFPFILSSEISLIYSQDGKGRRIHILYLAPSFEVVDKINAYFDTKGRRDYDGRPIFGISCEEFIREMKKISDDIEIIPAHIWTPWFGLFGSKGGFDSLKDAFGEQIRHIYAIETGISSDPEMNWRIKDLEGKSIISFSDSHSYWPWRMAREATIFTGKLSYKNIVSQIRNNGFKATIETDPAYGKYHWDGHRTCDFSCSPKETADYKGFCPKCGKPLIIGVENRVEELASSPAGHMSLGAKPFYKLLPLHELIAYNLDSNLNSKRVWAIYDELIKKFGNEFEILLRVDKNVLVKELKDNPKLAQLIVDNRIANIKIKPGYDGEYGEIILQKKQEEQKKLF